MHAHAIKHLEKHLFKGAKVLDVGSGSGILCAIFSYMVDTQNNPNSLVVGVDIYDNLINQSIINISKNHKDLLKSGRLKIFKADAWKGVKLEKSIENYYEYFDAIHHWSKSRYCSRIII